MDAEPTVSRCGRAAELSDLIDALQSAPKDRARYHEALSRIRFGIEAVQRYCHFDPRYYARNLIARTDKFELLALCWEPGQITPIHDHAGSDGWVYCVHGAIEEVRFQCSVSDDGTARVERGDALNATVGEMTYINDDIAWHTVANQTQERAVTLHLYSGPIDSCQYFDPGTRTIKTRQMKYFSADGVIRPGPH
jgi:predicted metal-dependent enzyme (double-stranded beta helix superfamily)